MDKQEQSFFDKTINVLNQEIATTKKKLAEVEEEFAHRKKALSEDFYSADKGEELGAMYSELSRLEEIDIDYHNKLRRIDVQKKNPYFSRIDFLAEGQTNKIYIGLSNIKDERNIIVYDWRTPIASMYYDFGIGEAYYKVDKDVYKGEITLKRQYKIENDTLVGYFDTNLAIEDDILRDVLSNNSSTKMKQIVSTIQREQNIIVRTEEFDNLLVQGVAGSGKTSIALHRAAYLLYSHRNTLKSSDILIMSPNNIFSSYISEVLPQLGEENLVETSFDQIARVELRRPLESREEMLDRIASNPSQEELNEISFKSSFEYLGELIKFLRGDFLNTFAPQKLAYVVGVKINKDLEEEKIEEVFPAEQTSKLFFDTFKNMTIEERISKIAWQYAMYFSEKRHYSKEQNKGLKERFKKILYNFLPLKDIHKVFEIFLTRMGLKHNESEEISYMDKGALLVIKHYIYGFGHDFSAKYLIIDEMQDFTPVDLYVFKKLWSCPSIVLGDINQCIEKTLTREYLEQVSGFLGTELIELKKTYRSTKEIAEFAHKMIDLKDVEYVNRNGEVPSLTKTTDLAKTIKEILAGCESYAHTAIICKCQKEVEVVKKALKGKVEFKELIEPDDYNNKVVLTTCATAKGIEFDCVLVPFANKENYVNSLDKNILYVSSTRALHKLCFIYDTTPTGFLSGLQK